MKPSKPFMVMAAVLVCILIYVQFFMGKKKAPVAQAADMPAPQAAVQSVAQTAPTVSAPIQLNLEWGKDPFVRPDALPVERAESGDFPALKLEGILDGQKGRMAIINKDIVQKGDTIGSELVHAIEKDRVVLMSNGAKRFLVLKDTSRQEGGKERVLGEKK